MRERCIDGEKEGEREVCELMEKDEAGLANQNESERD